MWESRPVVRTGLCNVCERRSLFVTRRLPPRGFRGALRCVRCGSRARHRHVAVAIVDALRADGITRLSDLRRRDDLRVLNVGHGSPIAGRLEEAPHIHNTAWWPDVPSGEHRDGVRCEDLTALSYETGSLDLVISEDVLEHIPAVRAALAEIHRVLRPGGTHVFTVPFHPDRPTKELFDLVDGEPVLHEPIEYHADPLRGRTPAFHRFGYTFLEDLAAAGFRTRLLTSNFHDQRRHAIVDCSTFITYRRRGAAPAVDHVERAT